jgi:single-strand DNA-binding protein
MSISYNRVVLVGRITREPESRYSTSGSHVVKFSIAVDRTPTSSQSETIADFIPVTAFGKLADFVSNYLSKGRLILVEGKLQINRIQGQDGTAKYFTDVVADSIRFMETKGSIHKDTYKNPKNETEPEETAAPVLMNDDFSETTLSPAANDSDESDDDEIPF